MTGPSECKAFGGERLPDKISLCGLMVWAHGSVVERRPDKTKVLGSIPSAPTHNLQVPGLSSGAPTTLSLSADRW